MKTQRKPRRLNIDSIITEMPVIEGELLRSIVGGYDNDCFWRCIAYIEKNIEFASISASEAAQYADDYYGPEAGLYYTGAAMTADRMREYISHNYSGSAKYELIQFDPSKIKNFPYTENMTHVVIVRGTDTNAEGEIVNYHVYDPQQGKTYEVPYNAMVNVFHVGTRDDRTDGCWEYGRSSVYGNDNSYCNGSDCHGSNTNGSSSGVGVGSEGCYTPSGY